MKRKLLEHLFSAMVVTGVLLFFLFFFQYRSQQAMAHNMEPIRPFINLPASDFNDPFYRALFMETLDLYYPGQTDRNQVIAKQLFRYKEAELSSQLQSVQKEKGLTLKRIYQIIGMYMGFLSVFAATLALTWYGVQSLALWRFIRRKQRLSQPPNKAVDPKKKGLNRLGVMGRFLASLILFSPAYTLAYSLRTEFDTGSFIFMVTLGVLSNGLLINYTNKFYAFLMSESRKGYVETALAKNLHSDYKWGAPGNMTRAAVFGLKKRFPGHVLDAIMRNARLQYLPTIKEQASFLITGLIIIEMALNIHAHLCYELLQQLLYRNMSEVMFMVLLIYYTVKLTEVAADIAHTRKMQQYDN